MDDFLFIVFLILGGLQVCSLFTFCSLLQNKLLVNDTIKVLIDSHEFFSKQCLFNLKFFFGKNHVRFTLKLVELASFIWVSFNHFQNQI